MKYLPKEAMLRFSKKEPDRMLRIQEKSVWLATLRLLAIGPVVVCAGCIGESGDAASDSARLTGTVVDGAGRPLEGAVVSIGRTIDAKPVDFHGLRATTDGEGKYSIPVAWTGGESLGIALVRVEMPGFVEKDWAEGKSVSFGEKFELDFVLLRGKVLAGRVERTVSAMERSMGLTAGSNRYRLIVENGDFQQSTMTEPGGEFSLTVPDGVYTIRVLDPPIVLTRVEAGTRDLLLTLSPVELTPQVLENAFDALWSNMNRHYSYFALKGVDWVALRDEYRIKLRDCSTVDEFTALLKEMLSHLKDLHVWLDTPQGVVGTWEKSWRRNWSPQAVLDRLAEKHECGGFCIVGKTKSGYGALIVSKQSAAKPASIRQAIEQLRLLGDVPGFIVDLRGGCTGGNEQLSRQLARHFCGKEVVYAMDQHRIGVAYTALSEPGNRVLPAAEEQAYTRPIVCLIGGKCMSSGEALVQMMSSLPHVTTVGMRTRGASGNPKPFKIPDMPISVWYSRWVDLMPDGSHVEGVGIAPDVVVDLPVSAYESRDPTWERAEALLHEQCD